MGLAERWGRRLDSVPELRSPDGVLLGRGAEAERLEPPQKAELRQVRLGLTLILARACIRERCPSG